WASFVLAVLAALEAMDGRFDDARAHLEEARLARLEFADADSLATNWAALAAEVELLGGDSVRAEEILSGACTVLRAAGDAEWLAPNTAILSEALYRQGRFAEALAVSTTALEIAPPDHLTSRAVARRVHAKALARAGRLKEAESLASATLELLA